MNTELNPDQTDTRQGDRTLINDSGVDLTGVTNLLLKIVPNTSTPSFALPEAVDDIAPFILADGDEDGQPISAEAPNLGENARVRAYGTGNAGDALILADPTANSGAQAGMVRSLVGSHAPSSGVQVFSPGIAEENFIDKQFVKYRPLPRVFTT